MSISNLGKCLYPRHYTRDLVDAVVAAVRSPELMNLIESEGLHKNLTDFFISITSLVILQYRIDDACIREPRKIRRKILDAVSAFVCSTDNKLLNSKMRDVVGKTFDSMKKRFGKNPLMCEIRC